jgi:hypothetical protein
MIEDITKPNLDDEPTMAAQTAFAADYAKAVFSNSVKTIEMTRSLENLSQLLKAEPPAYMPGALEPLLPDPGAALRDIQLPPMQSTMSCIQKLRSMSNGSISRQLLD